MCIIKNTGGETSNTILLNYRVYRAEEWVDVIGYFVKATSSGPNALILMVPVLPETTIAQDDLIDTTGFEWVLPKMAACRPKDKGMLTLDQPRSLGSNTIVTSVGKFGVVIARNNTQDINDALRVVRKQWPQRFPGYLTLNQGDYMDRCFKINPNTVAIIACWDGRDGNAGFFAFKHKSAFQGTPYQIHLGEDAHNEETPDQIPNVLRDQILVTANDGAQGTFSLGQAYEDHRQNRPWWLPECFNLWDTEPHGPNGNWLVKSNNTFGPMQRAHKPVEPLLQQLR